MAGYVASFTDSGHTTGTTESGVIQDTRELNVGKIQDFYSESLRLQYQWALRLANTYFGKPAARNYFQGCSTGGRQGMVLAQEHGEDFDGFLIGAPSSIRPGRAPRMWRVWLALEMTGKRRSAGQEHGCDLDDCRVRRSGRCDRRPAQQSRQL